MFYLWKRLWAVGCRLLSCRLAALCSCTRLTLTITHLQLIAACTSALRTLQSIQVFLLFSLILFKSDNSGVFRTIVMRIVEIHPDSSAAALCLKSQVSCFITQSCLSLRTLSLSFQLKGGPGARWGGGYVSYSAWEHLMIAQAELQDGAYVHTNPIFIWRSILTSRTTH